VAAGAGLWLASLYVPGVKVISYSNSQFFGFNLTHSWQIFLLLGVFLGLLNYFLRPILKTLSLPLEIVTLGLFTIVIDMALIWLIDIIFDELKISLWLPLLYTALIIWILNIIINFFLTKHN
jgi:putative membrane protein